MKEIKSTNTLINNLEKENEQAFEIGELKYIFETLQKNIYSNKPEAVAREIISNCFDANIESGSKRPIEVRLPNSENPNCITFRDFGIGMNDDRIKIYKTICASTKRDNNKEIGYFGIGSKSPFSITDTFNVKTFVNGVCHMYVIYKDNDCIPKITKVYEEPTTEPSGTEVIIPVTTEHLSIMVNYLNIVKLVNPFDLLIFDRDNKPFSLNFDNKYHEVKAHLPGKYKCYKSTTMSELSHLYSSYHGNYTNLIILVNGKIPYVYKFSTSTYTYGGNLTVVVNFTVGVLDLSANRETLAETKHNSVIINKLEKQCRNAIKELTESIKRRQGFNIYIDSFVENFYFANSHHASSKIKTIATNIYNNIGQKVPISQYRQEYIQYTTFVANSANKKSTYSEISKHICKKHNKRFVVFFGDKLNPDFNLCSYFKAPFIHNYALPNKTTVCEKTKTIPTPNINCVFSSRSFQLELVQKFPEEFRVVYTHKNNIIDQNIQKFLDKYNNYLENGHLDTIDNDGNQINIIKISNNYKKHMINVKEFDISEGIIQISKKHNNNYIHRLVANYSYRKVKQIFKNIISNYYTDRLLTHFNIPQNPHYNRDLNKLLTNNQKRAIFEEYKEINKQIKEIKEIIKSNPATVCMWFDRHMLKDVFIDKIRSNIPNLGIKGEIV